MSLVDRISRVPRPFDPARGSEAAEALGALPDAARDLVAGAAGCSPYLSTLVVRHADWLRPVLDQSPERALDEILETAGEGAAAETLRVAKARVALLVGLADLGGAWSLAEVTGALTRFADLAVARALAAAFDAELARRSLPGSAEADPADCAGMAVIAMGKMGAHELNYSSDIDLICLFDETRFDPGDYGDARAFFVRVTRRMTALLSDHDAGGYVFRTDLRLRPDAAVTPVCLSMEAAERYYESLGRTWERAAYIKARPVAGDTVAGAAFLRRLTPFIWRKHLDFAAIRDAHDIRLKIRAHKSKPGQSGLDGRDVKLGQGGIREIEFFTQTRQLIAGGRDPDLRQRGTEGALAALAAKGWVPDHVRGELVEDYRALREVEHRLQMVQDAQTHTLPGAGDGWDRLAAFCGTSEEALRDDLAARFDRVHRHAEGFFDPSGETRPLPALPAMPDDMDEIVARWPRYPALRSPRAAEIFGRLLPALLTRLERAAHPREALVQIDAFLAGLPAGVQVFSLFDANPQLLDLVVDVAATAPELSRYLGRHSQVFDAVIGGAFFADWPGTAALRDALVDRLNPIDDYERKLDAARRWAKEWHFRVGVHHLRGLIDAAEAGTQYCDLAEAVVAALWPEVIDEFSRRHGAPPGIGASVVAMGSLGAGRLTAASDLDLIVIYDPGSAESSEGRQPLHPRTYYPRLTKMLVTALTAAMAEGKLYEVDMRLRPSGRQGPVATSFDAFRTYQREQAWTWEHLALTRARPIAGPPSLCDAVESFRQDLLHGLDNRTGVLADVADMRARLAEAKPGGLWDFKDGPGRIQDIDLIAQAGALLDGQSCRRTAEQLQAGVAAGLFAEGAAERLAAAHALFSDAQAVARLVTGGAFDPDLAGAGATAFMLRETGADSLDALAEEADARAGAAAAIIGESLAGRGQAA